MEYPVCFLRPFIVFILVFIPVIPDISLAESLFTQEKKLVRLEESWSGSLGTAIAAEGDTLMVGANGWRKTENCCSAGAVFMYSRSTDGSNTWVETKKIVPSDATSSSSNTVHGFGSSVALSGDTLVVGSYHSSTITVPKIYIYQRDQGGVDNWGLLKKIAIPISQPLALDGDTIVVIGGSVAYILERDVGGTNSWGTVKEISIPNLYRAAIDGDTAVFGRYADNVAQVFERNRGGIDNWGETIVISPSDGAPEDRFGADVAIHENTIVVAATYADDNGEDSGSAYIFERNNGGTDNWGQSRKILPSSGSTDDYFGTPIGIESNTLIIGARYSDAAYIFYRNRDGVDQWGQVKEISPTYGWVGSSKSLFLTGSKLFLGSPVESEKGYFQGMAYVFDKNEGGEDNWGEQQFLITEDKYYVAGDRFGTSVSMHDNSLAVGAYLDDESGSSSGAVYIFEKDLLGIDNWGQYRKITSIYATTAAGDNFGNSVSIAYEVLVVGAHLDDDMGSNAGAAYVFSRNHEGSDGWGYDKDKKLVAADGAPSDYFGYQVATSGDTVVVGAYQDDDNGTSSGSAYVFQQDQGGSANWGQVKKLLPPDGASSDYFGYRVAIFGDIIVIGAYRDDDKGSSSGSVYVFMRDYGGFNNWGMVKKILPSDGAASDNFGRALYLDLGGNVLIVGAPGDDDNGSSSGSAYIFYRDLGGSDNWGLFQKLSASDGAAGDNFGWSVSVNFGVAAIGAYLDDDSGTGSGAAYIFERQNSGYENWLEVQKITASDGAASDNFGEAVTIFGTALAVSAPVDDDYGSASGSVYLYSFVIDSDGDGLSDEIENEYCTLTNDADTDDDGIIDGIEDANHNGIVDAGEPNPCSPDSDADGVQDGTEIGLTTSAISTDTDLSVFIADEDTATVTYPTIPDTDGDGFTDGEEDSNYNGMVELGETDPTTKMGDVDGNGIQDLTDLILVLKGMSGLENSGSFAGDRNGDGKIGLAEAIYILQKVVTESD
ncbi:MAG: hypothetical protein GY702_23945 [Desulfobulbaceae bacterium]|nr:hypothetical protein [Desulfobulbaceae bacterium]